MQMINSSTVGRRLKRYSALEHILLGDLRDLLQEPAVEETRRWLLAVLDTLLEALPREMQLREEGGYLSEVLDQYPNWYDRVDRLRNERRELYVKLRQLRQHLVQDLAFEQIADEVRQELRDWMTRLTAQRRHEDRLVLTAFNLDVGGGD